LVSTPIWPSKWEKLQLLNYVLSALPTFYMCTIKVPIDIINQIDKYMRHRPCMGDVNVRKNPTSYMEVGNMA
jgi:hypothetical protein